MALEEEKKSSKGQGGGIILLSLYTTTPFLLFFDCRSRQGGPIPERGERRNKEEHERTAEGGRELRQKGQPDDDDTFRARGPSLLLQSWTIEDGGKKKKGPFAFLGLFFLRQLLRRRRIAH